MGIFCKINLFKPADGAFVPGSTVSGIIEYAVDQETEFKRIVLSLKGNGRLLIRDNSKKRRNENRHTYRNFENYVDIETMVYNGDKPNVVPIGGYEVPFTFTLPQSLPPSLEYVRRTARYSVRCHIKYYISMRFERVGLFKLAKTMKKDITVVSGIKPRLPMEPTIYGEQKKLFQLFSNKPNVVNIKANIETCVVAPGGKVQLSYEIFNHTKLNLKGVETKLIETYTFTTNGHRKVKISDDVENTDFKTGSVASGNTSSMDLTINLPSNIGSLEYSNLVSRDYFVQITAEIPFPHWNARLEIPIQVGDKNEPNSSTVDDPPPSYWEAMTDDVKKEEEDSDDDDGKS